MMIEMIKLAWGEYLVSYKAYASVRLKATVTQKLIFNLGTQLFSFVAYSAGLPPSEAMEIIKVAWNENKLRY